MKSLPILLAAVIASVLAVVTGIDYAPAATTAAGEQTTVNKYKISGTGNGTGFTMTVNITGVGTASFTVPSDPIEGSLPPGTTAGQFAVRIAQEINALTGTLPGISAVWNFDRPGEFSIRYTDQDHRYTSKRGITLFVGGVDGCKVTAPGCQFNPKISLINSVGGEQALPDAAGNADSGGSSLPYAIAGAAMGLVVIGAGGWYARRRWLS